MPVPSLGAAGVPDISTSPPRKVGWELTCTVCGWDTSLKGAAWGAGSRDSPSPGSVATVAARVASPGPRGGGRARRGLALRQTLSCVRGGPGTTSVGEEEEEGEEGQQARGWLMGLRAPHGSGGREAGGGTPGSSAMCRSSAGSEPWPVATWRGRSGSAGKTLPWDGTFFRPGLVAGGAPGGWGGAGLSRLEEELRRLSPSLPGPGRVWKEATRAMPLPLGPRLAARLALSRLRSSGLWDGLGLGPLPMRGAGLGCSKRWLSTAPEGSGDAAGEPGTSSTSSVSSASNDFLSAG